MNLVNGRNVGELPGLRIYTASRKTEKSRQADVLILLLHAQNMTPTVKEFESWGRILSDTYYSARGSFTMGISAAGRRFTEYLQENYPADQLPEVRLNMAVLRGQTLMISHAGPVNTTVIFADHVENFNDEMSEPLRTSAVGLRFFQVEIHSGDLLLMCPQVPNGWTNDAILDATSESPLNVIRYLLSQADGSLQAAVVQIKAGRGEITYRYKPPIMANIQPEYSGNMEPKETQTRNSSDVITPGVRVAARQMHEPGDSEAALSERPLYRSRVTKDSIISVLTEPGAMASSVSVDSDPGKTKIPSSQSFSSGATQTSLSSTPADSEDMPKKGAPTGTDEHNESVVSDEKETNDEYLVDRKIQEESVCSETEQTKAPEPQARCGASHKEKDKPRRNWKRFLIVLGCGILIPGIVVSALFMVYSGRSKNKLHREYLSQAVDTAQTALEQTEPLMQDAAWDKTLEYLDEAAIYGSSPAARDLRMQTLQALDTLGKGRKTIYRYGLASPLPKGMLITDILADGQYTYALDSGSGSVIRFVASGKGLTRDNSFVCTPGSYYSKAYLQELKEANKDVRFDADLTKKIAVSSFVGFVLLPAGNPQSDVLAAVDNHANVVYCSAYSDNTAEKLSLPVSGLAGVDAAFFMQNNMYLLDTHSSALWVYDYDSQSGFTSAPVSYFGSSAPNMTDIVDFAAYENYTYFLRENGTLAVCDFTGYQPQCSNVTEIRSEAGDVRIDLTRRNITQLMINRSPDNSIYLMDEKLQTAINLSVKLNFVRYIVPDRNESDIPSAAKASAFGISGANKLIWAYNADIYVGNMP